MSIIARVICMMVSIVTKAGISIKKILKN